MGAFAAGTLTFCAENDDDATYYSINFFGNGGKGAMGRITVLEGKAIKLPESTFIKEGAKFARWQGVKAAANVKDLKEGDYIDTFDDKEVIRPEENMTLIAQWE